MASRRGVAAGTPLRFLVLVVVLATHVATGHGQTPYEKNLEIRTSTIPHAGNGVFAKAAIPKGAYLGAYTGEFLTDDEYQRRAAANRWQYMMGLLDCAKPHTGGLTIIDGVSGNVFTRMNYAPPEFQNVKFEKICEAPFVRIVALRDIAAGEELWVDYGPLYRYDFMEDPAVVKFFADLRVKRGRSRQGPQVPHRRRDDLSQRILTYTPGAASANLSFPGKPLPCVEYTTHGVDPGSVTWCTVTPWRIARHVMG
jgi:uncharacterized protein